MQFYFTNVQIQPRRIRKERKKNGWTMINRKMFPKSCSSSGSVHGELTQEKNCSRDLPFYEYVWTTESWGNAGSRSAGGWDFAAFDLVVSTQKFKQGSKGSSIISISRKGRVCLFEILIMAKSTALKQVVRVYIYLAKHFVP